MKSPKIDELNNAVRHLKDSPHYRVVLKYLYARYGDTMEILLADEPSGSVEMARGRAAELKRTLTKIGFDDG